MSNQPKRYRPASHETVEFELTTGKTIRMRMENGQLIVRACGDYDRLLVFPEASNALTLDCA